MCCFGAQMSISLSPSTLETILFSLLSNLASSFLSFHWNLSFLAPTPVSLTEVEWQTIQEKCTGGSFERCCCWLSHYLTSSLTARNNLVLMDTWCPVERDEEVEKKVGDGRSFNVSTLIRDLNLINCMDLKFCTLIMNNKKDLVK